MSAVTTEQVVERLEILWKQLEDEGAYVRANTVNLAIGEIRQLAEMAPYCMTCGGSGRMKGVPDEPCSICDGTGTA